MGLVSEHCSFDSVSVDSFKPLQHVASGVERVLGLLFASFNVFNSGSHFIPYRQ